MASRGFDFQAADARPYALGTLVLSGGLPGLVHWLDSGRMRDGLVFAACAAALWWVHLVFWPFYVVFLIYGAYRVWTGESEVTWAQVVSVITVVLIGCAPVAIRALSLLHGASAHVVVPRPSFSDFLSELKLGMVTGACAAAALLSRWFRWSPSPGPVAHSSIVLIMAWWLVDPLALYFVSTTTSTSLFVPRYMYLALPGAALVACALARLFIPGRLWKPVAACLGCTVLLFGGHWNRIWPAHQNSDWRTASHRLRDWSGNADVPVICPSPFIEARAPVWSPNYPVSGFLYSHLAVYPITGHVYPFPFESSPEAAAFARKLTAGTLTNAGRFAVFGGDQSVRFWRDWFAAQPEFSAWNNEVLGLYGDVEIVGFIRKLSRTP